MRKLLILILLSLSLGLSGQMIGIIAGSGGAAPAGCTAEDNYGDETTELAVAGVGADRLFYIPVSVTSGGSVCKVTIYIGANVSAHSKIALYTDNSGAPNTRIANSISEEIVLTANSWNEFTFTTSPTVSSGTIWVCYQGQTSETSIWGGGGSGPFAIDYQDGVSYASGHPATATPGNWQNMEVGVYISVDH